MGEEQSQNPDQQGEQPRYDLEQKPEQDEVVQSNAEGEQATEMAEPTSVDQNNGPDTRWDHDKAETMAAALKEDGSFDDVIKQRDAVKQDVNSKEYLDRHTDVESDNLRIAQQEVANLSEHHDDYTQAFRKKTLEEDQEMYDTAVVETHALGEGAIERSRQKVDKVVDEVLSPYQELYDMNPAAFKEMRTEEFMVIAYDLAEISSKLEANERDLKIIEGYNDTIKDAIEGGRLVNGQLIADLSAIIEDCLDIYTPHMTDSAYAQVRKKFNAENANSFDKTPRQIMEGYMRVAGEYTSQFKAKKLADEQRKKEFLDKYKPEASTSDQN